MISLKLNIFFPYWLKRGVLKPPRLFLFHHTRNTGTGDDHLTLTAPVNLREGGKGQSAVFSTDYDGAARTAVVNAPTQAGAAGWSVGAFKLD